MLVCSIVKLPQVQASVFEPQFSISQEAMGPKSSASRN